MSEHDEIMQYPCEIAVKALEHPPKRFVVRGFEFGERRPNARTGRSA